MDSHENHDQSGISSGARSLWNRIRWTIAAEYQHRVGHWQKRDVERGFATRLKARFKHFVFSVQNVVFAARREALYGYGHLVWAIAPLPFIKWKERWLWVKGHTVHFLYARQQDFRGLLLLARTGANRVVDRSRHVRQMMSCKCECCRETMEPYGFVANRSSLVVPYLCDECGTISPKLRFVGLSKLVPSFRRRSKLSNEIEQPQDDMIRTAELAVGSPNTLSRDCRGRGPTSPVSVVRYRRECKKPVRRRPFSPATSFCRDTTSLRTVRTRSQSNRRRTLRSIL